MHLCLRSHRHPMKRSRSYPNKLEQLEFEDLLAEATDICVRMRSIRRKDIVFCQLQIPGWQTSEARRLHLTPAFLDEAWLEERFQNIRTADTIHEVLILTATYIGEVLDEEMQDQSGTDAWGTGYAEHCRSVVEAMSDNDGEGNQFGVVCCETAAAARPRAGPGKKPRADTAELRDGMIAAFASGRPAQSWS